MVVWEAVFKTVLTIARLATNGDGGVGVDECFAGRMGALSSCCQSCIAGAQGGGGRGGRLFSFGGCPFSGVGAFVGGFGAVIEAVGSFAGFAAEGEEVELVAVGVLTVGADGFDVYVHGCKGLRVWWSCRGGGSHDEDLEGVPW